jgi:hypothetical protein
MLAQASIVVFTTGLPGKPPITKFSALPTKQDTGYRARRKTHASPAGRHEKLPAERAGHETDMMSHLC